MRPIISFFLISLLLIITSLVEADTKGELTFWTTEVERDRLKVQRQIAKTFSQRTGLKPLIVPVQENMLAERVTAAYAARALPDVIFHPIDFTIGWAEAGILDISSATELVNRLGRETFGKGPLDLVKVPSGTAALPIDGWGQLLIYRKDLFSKKNLPPPNTWNRILQAAKALHNPPLIWGFEIATDPGEIYTQQVFEHIALSNSVKLTDSSGKININTPALIQTLQFYKKLTEYTPPGNLNWLHTRMDYLSGRAAMIIWSPFILDELSGLRRDQPVLPDLAKGKPGFLAKNSGFVPIIKGPKGSAQYGQINYLGITVDAKKEMSKRWVKFLLTEAYLKWLGLAAEGKLPVRKGTREEPNRFVNGWMGLEFGVTSRAQISRFYGHDVLKTIMSGIEGFDRWGFSAGKGALITKIYRTKVIPEVLKRFLNRELSAKEAARMMEKRVKALD